MNILDAQANKNLIVSGIISGREAKVRLNNMGLHLNDKIIKLSDNKWGPILIKNLSNDSIRIAVGRGLAEKIEVRYED